MKLFIDSAIIEEIEHVSRLGLIDGVTTNPSLIRKSGRKVEVVLQDPSFTVVWHKESLIRTFNI